MAITKLGNTFMSSTAGRLAGNVGRDLVNPFNLGIGALQAASGDMSVGEVVGGTAAGTAGFTVARHLAENKLAPALSSFGANAASKAAPLWRRVAGKAASGLGSRVSMLGWMTALPAAVMAATPAARLARKYAPIYKRKSPEQVAAERVPLVQG